MRSFYLSAILLVTCLSCSERGGVVPSEPPIPEGITELRAMLRTDIDEETKLAIYNRLAFRLRDDAPEEARRYAHFQLELAKRTENDLYEGKAYYLLGYVETREKNYPSSIEHYLHATDRFEEVSDNFRLGDTYNNIGEIFLRNDLYGSAVPYFEKAVEYYDAAKEEKYRVLAMENLAIAHWRKKDPDFERAAGIYGVIIAGQLEKAEADPAYIVKLYTNYGFLNFDRGEYTTAIAQYEHALDRVGGLKNEGEYRARLYSNLAEAYMHQGEAYYSKAVEYMDKGAAIKDGIPSNSKFMVQRLNMRGELAMRLGNHGKALGIFAEAIAMADRDIVNEPLQETLVLMEEAQRSYRAEGGQLSYEDAHIIRELERKQESAARKIRGGLDRPELQAALERTVKGYENDRAEARLTADRDRTALMGNLKMAIALIISMLGLVWTNRAFYKKDKRIKMAAKEIESRNADLLMREARLREYVIEEFRELSNEMKKEMETWIDWVKVKWW